MLSSKDISDLEEKYKKYRYKKGLKIFLYIFISLLILSSSVYYISISNKKEHKKSKEQNSSLTEMTDLNSIVKTEKKIILIQKKDTISEAPKKKTIIKEINNIIKPIKDITKYNTNLNKNIKKTLPNNQFNFKLTSSNRTLTNHSKRVKLNFRITKNKSKNNSTLSENSKKPKIEIIMKDIDSISYLKKKFNKTNDIIFALMLCESYYAKKDFNNSLKWSIIANDIDSSGERSWMWFAKSKYRLNKKRDAIRALKAFLKTNDSKDVKSLLRDIENGVLND